MMILLYFAAQCSESADTNSILTERSTPHVIFLTILPTYRGTRGFLFSIISLISASFRRAIFSMKFFCVSVSRFLSHQSCHSNSVRKLSSRNPFQNLTLSILTLYHALRAMITSFFARSMPSISSFGFGSVSPRFIAFFTATEYSTHEASSPAIPERVPDQMRSIRCMLSIGHLYH